MRKLSEILTLVEVSETIGETDQSISNIYLDSRLVKQAGLFVAIRGVQADGHRFIEKAIEKGAVAIVCEKLPNAIKEGICYLKVPNSGKAIGQIAHNFYKKPSQKIKIVGVTGTNGKTTSVTLLYRLFTDLGYKVGLLSTVENRIGKRVIPATHTTPDAIQLNQLLAKMVEEGCDFAFMEVSSHAIHQNRIAGVAFAGGVFTNISHDHLDYHNTFKEYINVKKQFFDDLPKSAFALSNIDDKRGMVMLQNTKASKYTYGLKKLADFKARIIENSIIGLHLNLDQTEFYGRLVGDFNAYNYTAIYATARLLGIEKEEVLASLSQLKTAEGRFDTILDEKVGIMGIVDYAHTPDALEKVLTTIHAIRTNDAKIITIVGCGGDRDRKKRPIMAKVAVQWSDQIILTADNPRTEDPESILDEMEEGISDDVNHKVLRISNREQAIKTASRLAKMGDIILLAGKGHEKYQEINGEKFPFDDKQILTKEITRK